MIELHELEQVLRQTLPPHLQQQAPILAQILSDVSKNQTDSEAVNNAVTASSPLQDAVKSLAGKEVLLDNGLVAFGQGNQLGDVEIKELAGGNITKLSLNITESSSAKNTVLGAVIIGVFLIMAAVIAILPSVFWGINDNNPISGNEPTSINSNNLPQGHPTSSPQVVSLFPENLQSVAQKASEGILDAAKSLPLIVEDEFTNNDYGWPIDENTYTDGVTCTTSIQDDSFNINVNSTNGPAYCYAGITKEAKDFVASADVELERDTNADVFLYYRLSDDGLSFYYISLNPQTQILSIGAMLDNHQNIIVPPTYIKEINKNTANTLTIIALSESQVLYINGVLICTFTDNRLLQGQFRFAMTLQEAHTNETLQVSSFDVRGN